MVDVQIVRRGEPESPHAVTLHLSGALDLSSVPNAHSAIDSAVHTAIADGVTHLVVDLDDVHAVDAAGIGVLATARSRAIAADISIMFVGGAPDVVERLRDAGIGGSQR